MKFTRTRWPLAGAALASLLALGVTAAAALPANQAVPEGFEQDRSAELAGAIDPSEPRNVIMIVGDGMDDSMITAARNYELGAGGRFEGLDSLPFTGAMTTYGLKVGPDPEDYPVAYVSDSAPTASGWSTGEKTVDSRVSQGPSAAQEVPGEDYETVLQQFAEEGKLTGNITTSEITDATPAAAASSINARACQGPANMAGCPTALKSADGKGSIAEQLVDNEVDVLMGGGLSRYEQATEDGPTVQEYAEETYGYRTVQDSDSLNAITDLDDGPVLGLFADGNMTPRYEPLVATPPPGAGGPAQRCTPADRGSQPDIAAMTEKSLELLDNPEGFFLQVESAMIDKQEHAMDTCGAIGDLVAIDEVVQAALTYQAENPDTLIVVTGDHSHSTQIVGDGNGGRQTATLLTADGDPMSVAYSTGIGGSNHTGAQIRVAASGPQAANVTGVIDQTDLYQTLLGREPSELPGPGEPEPLAPQVSVAAPGTVDTRLLRQRGVVFAVAASGSERVSLRVRIDGRQIRSATLPARGGNFRVKLNRFRPGTLVLQAVARGDGQAQATKRVSVRR